MTPDESVAHKRSFEDGKQFAWDATSIELAQTCLRKYYYAMVRGVAPKHKSVHLIFGGIYASALENFYKWRAEGDSIDLALNKTIRLAMTQSWDTETNQPKIFDDDKKTRVALIRTIVWYIEQFADESSDGLVTHHLANGKPAVELSFTLEVTDDIVFCGHLDRVVKMGDSLYIMDQKTTGGTVGTYYFRQFSPSNQMSLYSWAGKAVLHSPISGVIIDAAQVAINFTRFERGITTRSRDQLDEWLESALYTIDLAQKATEANKWPMNLASCGNYGGCPFRSLCSTSPAVRENYIKADFVDHNWDPLEAR
jgi:hypothetical protein